MTDLDDKLNSILDYIFLELHNKAVGNTGYGGVKQLKAQAKAQLKTLVAEQVVAAQTNAVAWAVGVIDDLHINDYDIDSRADADYVYKGVKNTLRDRYKAEIGIDPAPSYPINAQLKDKQGE